MPQPTSTRSTAELSSIFKDFATRECQEVSPLYYQLAQDVAQSLELLRLAAHARARQPIPNLFFGAVHYLLLLNPKHELAQYYPSITKAESKGIPMTLFHDFCKRSEAEIIDLLRSRIVQTNAINRTAYLMPIASSQFRGASGLNLVDIGCSSGLNLNFDRYQYLYNEQAPIGEGTVRIKSDIREGKLPTFAKMAQVKRRIGIDQNPLDLRIVDNATWLKALIWPDLLARFDRMEAAITTANESKIELLRASQMEEFRSIINQIPSGEPLLVYHTHVLYQFSPEERMAFRQLMDEIGKSRNLSYLAVEGHSVFDGICSLSKGIQIVLTTYHEGIKTTEHLGTTDGHATWIRWK